MVERVGGEGKGAVRVRGLCGRRLLCLVAILLAAGGLAGGGTAWGQEVKVEAPSFRFDQKENRYEYEEARLTLGEFILFASHVTVWPEKSQVLAEGNVRFINRTVYGDAERMEFNLKDRFGTLHRATVFDTATGYRLEADTLELHADGSYLAKGCSFTNCPSDVVGWNLYTSSLSVSGRNTAVALNTTFRMGVVPMLWVPVFAWPTSHERQSGFLVPHMIQNSSSLPRLNLGWRLKMPLFLALGPEQNLTLEPEWIQRRGTALKADYEYAFLPGQRGQLVAWGLQERYARNPAVENLIIPYAQAAQDPYAFRRKLLWRHSQPLGETGRITWDYGHGGDGQVFREYDNQGEERPYHTWQAGVTRQGWLGDLSLSGERRAEYTAESIYADSARQTDRKQALLVAPRFEWRLGGRPVEALPLGLELGLQATDFTRSKGLEGRLLMAEPGVALPLNFGAGLELRATARRRLARYEHLKDNTLAPGSQELLPEQYAQNVGEVNVLWNFGRTYPQTEGGWEALHHRITPRLVYAEVKDASQPLAGQVLAPRPAVSLLTFRLDNALLARKAEPDTLGGTAPSSVLSTLNLSQRYNLLMKEGAPELRGPRPDFGGETAPGNPLLPLRLEGVWTQPVWSLSGMVDYHHQRKAFTRKSLGLNAQLTTRVRGGMGYTFNAFSHATPEGVLVPQQSTLQVGTNVTLWDYLTMGFDSRFNLKDKPPPMNRPMEYGVVSLSYHPVCYELRMVYEEIVASSSVGGGTYYYVDKRVSLRFEITGLSSGDKAPSRVVTP
ncbi:MAG: hypothetical protein OEW39_15865, partial [Deltaproteobacteria bacterium]|nr:hypothetical protein [Deltaproteobacteria bacterium]